MTRRLRVHPEAVAEAVHGARYYQGVAPGLGGAFEDELSRAIDDIRWDPDAWPRFPGWDRLPVVRSRRLGRFPYRAVYFEHDEDLIVVAVAHERRRPGYWADRIDR